MDQVEMTFRVDKSVKNQLDNLVSDFDLDLDFLFAEFVERMLCGTCEIESPTPAQQLESAFCKSYDIERLKRRRNLSSVCHRILDKLSDNPLLSDGDVDWNEAFCKLTVVNAIECRLDDKYVEKLYSWMQNDFDHAQMGTLFLAIKDGIITDEEIDFIASRKLYASQMEEIIAAFENGLSISQVSPFAKRNVSVKNMNKLRKELEKDIVK